ncbi:RNA polymerase sigma factor [Paenibacillus sp. JX-17]|uniref:RNA polymerase sigma factor n=1 Tax=Paenibacillus lacisoli TaxID=3064525 RepID=A0ABT9CGQ5_9BACL|nr:RNA polymerase sigma factor [Paenibacillus sp. JX-17]MDO7906866.1 RNA polymerase sigma factor [Paenibacillus sp. JX-17]
MNDRELFETYREHVYRFCRYMMHSEADAEDICQEVFVKAMLADRSQIRELKPWLLRIASNECMTILQRRRKGHHKEKLVYLLSLTKRQAQVEENWENAETKGELERLLGQLSVPIRSAILLRYSGDLSIAETAEVLGIAEGTVKSRVNRGLRILRRMFNESRDEIEPEGDWKWLSATKNK